MLLILTQGVSAETAFKNDKNWHSRQSSAMGTLINVELYCEDAEKADHLIDWVSAEMNRIDRLMSPYKPQSELAQINARAADGAISISPELYDLIDKALQHGYWSQGTFDITFASAGFQYDYRKKIKPSAKALSRAVGFIDYHAIRLLPDNKIEFTKPGVKIDLGGIAKGHAVDRAIDYLLAKGIQHAIVSAGGDSRIIGDHRGRPWILGIQHPRDDGHVVSLPLESIAVSTSGDYERYFIDQEGVRYHHILNPKSGKSAAAVQSVTILGPNATLTDALSTTVFVMGVKTGLAYINKLKDVSAIIIDANGKLHYSSDLVRPTKN
ncbi:MAG: FAD:protein FMN transferase [Pseudomonadales bacterium]|nr:FAD:protein FMN transferase [Pseudomonadales bacterium]